MTNTIEATSSAKVVTLNGQASSTIVGLVMRYTDGDPLSIEFTFVEEGQDDVGWNIGRDLLIECFNEGSAGGHEVLLVDNDEFMTMILMSPEGSVVLQIDAEEVNLFIDETVEMIPVGSEDINSAMEEFLKETLEA